MRYTFVTVVFADEIVLHQLQARSMVRYLSPDMIDSIIVIENSAMPDGWRTNLHKHYGPLARFVSIIPAARIAAVSPKGGWFAQQILKLMISRHITTDRYLILDAKNTLVFPLEPHHLEQDGKIRSFCENYQRHPLRRYLKKAIAYFDIDADMTHFGPTVTPFVAPTAYVRQLVSHVERKEGGSFEQFFSGNQMTEFFLFMAYLISINKMDALYDFSGTNYSVIWEFSATDDARIKRDIEITEQQQRPFFSVHRRARPHLTGCGRQMIAEFWWRRKLFASVDDALQMI